MKKELKEKIDRWIEFSESIRKIYLKIIKHEQDNNYDQEYNDLLYLLQTAITMEKKIIDDIKIDEKNWREIKAIIDCPNDYFEKILVEKENSFEILRRSNILDDILLYKYNNFFSKKLPTNIFEFIANTNYHDELNNLKYADVFLKNVTTNFIAMIQKYINEVQDVEVRNYLIYLKYGIICTSPTYESAFLELNGQILPTININTNFPDIDGFTKEGIDGLNHYNIKEAIESDLVQAFSLDDILLDEPIELKLLYRILALSKAHLISFKDDSFISELEASIDEIRPINSDYSRVNALVNEMFKDAHEIVKQPYYVAKKIRN